MATNDLRFKVVAVADCGEELLGTAADPLLAHVLLGAAAAMYPRRKIELRSGARPVEPGQPMLLKYGRIRTAPAQN